MDSQHLLWQGLPRQKREVAVSGPWTGCRSFHEKARQVRAIGIVSPAGAGGTLPGECSPRRSSGAAVRAPCTCSFPFSPPSRPICVVVSPFTEPSRIPPLPIPLGLHAVLFKDYSCVLGPAGLPQVAGCGQAVRWSRWPAWSPAGTVVESTELPRTHSVLSGEAGWRRTHSHS